MTTTANINTGVNSLSAVRITKKAFNAALVENTTAQIYGRSSTYNRLNDIVAAVNNKETMQQVNDGAEWRTVVKTRSNGVVFSNGSTLDYAPNNHENDVNYYRVGNVVIMVAARRNDASDADMNPFIYLVVAYLIDAPETTPTTPETETTMTTTDTPTTAPAYEETHAARCLHIYLNNSSHIYQYCTQPAIDLLVNEGATLESAEVKQCIKNALYYAAREVQKYDHMTPTAADVEHVKRDYIAYIIECAQYETATA